MVGVPSCNVDVPTSWCKYRQPSPLFCVRLVKWDYCLRNARLAARFASCVRSKDKILLRCMELREGVGDLVEGGWEFSRFPSRGFRSGQ